MTRGAGRLGALLRVREHEEAATRAAWSAASREVDRRGARREALALALSSGADPARAPGAPIVFDAASLRGLAAASLVRGRALRWAADALAGAEVTAASARGALAGAAAARAILQHVTARARAAADRRQDASAQEANDERVARCSLRAPGAG